MKVRCGSCGNTVIRKKGETLCPYCGAELGKERKSGRRLSGRCWILIAVIVLLLLPVLARAAGGPLIRMYWEKQWESGVSEIKTWKIGDAIPVFDGCTLQLQEENVSFDPAAVPEGQKLLVYSYTLTPYAERFGDDPSSEPFCLSEIYMFADGQYLHPCPYTAAQNMGMADEQSYSQNLDRESGRLAFLIPAKTESVSLVLIEHDPKHPQTRIIRHEMEAK